MSKLARVTEELESLIHPTASTVHEEDEENEKETPASVPPEKASIMKIVEPEESIVLPKIPGPITTAAEFDKKADIVTTEVSY